MSDTDPADSKQKKGQRNEMRMITRAASILRALGEEPSGLSLGQLSKATGLARSTVQRLVGAMEVERLVATEAGNVGVRIGAEIPRLANAALRDVKSVIRPAIEELHFTVEDTVDVSILQNAAAVVVDQAFSSGRILRVVSQVGSVLPLHCTSNGKIHLAQMSQPDLDAFFSKPLKSRTANTITDPALLLEQIEVIRAGGFSEDLEEYTEGVCAVSLPVLGYADGNYTFGVLMPSQRYYERKELVQDAMRRCQAAIQNRFGH